MQARRLGEVGSNTWFDVAARHLAGRTARRPDRFCTRPFCAKEPGASVSPVAFGQQDPSRNVAAGAERIEAVVPRPVGASSFVSQASEPAMGPPPQDLRRKCINGLRPFGPGSDLSHCNDFAGPGDSPTSAWRVRRLRAGTPAATAGSVSCHSRSEAEEGSTFSAGHPVSGSVCRAAARFC